MYGDCLFVTISPNEQHSDLVLRLIRYRRNDPHVKYGESSRRQLASRDYPSLEAMSEKDRAMPRVKNEAEKDRAMPSGNNEPEEVFIELPEYDLRRAATAQDPLSVIEGY